VSDEGQARLAGQWPERQRRRIFARQLLGSLLRFDTLLELAVVLGLVVVAEGRGDEAVVSDRPLLEAADPDPASRPTGAGVRSDERPAIFGLLAVHQQLVHEHLHIREGNHERSGGLCDRGSPHRGRPIVDRQRPVGRVVLGHARRILAAPRIGVPPGELTQLIGRRRHGSSSFATVVVFCPSTRSSRTRTGVSSPMPERDSSRSSFRAGIEEERVAAPAGASHAE
jgi:hypothetical protein